MSNLSGAQVAAAAIGAGFTGTALVHAVAVSFAEDGNHDPRRVAVNSDAWRSRDRGLWQINDHWHKEVSDAAAFDPASAAAAAYRISGGGRNWSAWSTWRNGAAAAEFGAARIAIAQVHAAGGANAQAAGFFSGGNLLGGFGAGGLGVPIIPPGELVDGLDPFGNPFGGPGKDNPHQLGPAHAFDTPKPGNGGTGTGGGQSWWQSLGTMATLGAHAAGWIADSHNWLRVAMVAGGGFGLLMALHMIAQSGAAGSTAQGVSATVTNAAKDAAKTAAVAAAA